MKARVSKRCMFLISVLVVLSMVASFAGCGQSQSSTATADSADSSAVETTVQSETAAKPPRKNPQS